MRWMTIANVGTAFIGKKRGILCQANATDTLQREYRLRMAALLMTGLLPMKTIIVENIVPILQERARPKNPLKKSLKDSLCRKI